MQWLKPSTLRPGGERELAHNRVQILATPDVRFGSKADMCGATRDVRFTPNSDRESGPPQTAMSALPQIADMCGAPADVCWAKSGHLAVTTNSAFIKSVLFWWLRVLPVVLPSNRTRYRSLMESGVCYASTCSFLEQLCFLLDRNL